MRTAEQVLEAVREAGVRLRVSAGWTLQATGPVPDWVQGLIDAYRTELGYLVLHEQRHGESALAELPMLRRFVPDLLRTITLVDGKQVILWGVSPRGVVVSQSLGRSLITLLPEDLIAP